VQDGARRLEEVRRVLRITANALQNLMHCVAIGEDVMCRFPIPVLVRRAKPSDPQRRRITQRAAEVST
jgi:hypothetical protein